MRAFSINVLRMLLTLLGVVTITFFLGRLTGDPLQLLMSSTTSTAEDYARTRERMGLDQPLPVQYIVYLNDVLHGNLGNSMTYSRPALAVVLERLPATLQLGIPSLLLSVAIGLPLGIITAYRRGSWLDVIVMRLSLASQSLPQFFVGILLILVLAVQLRLFPTFGRDSAASFVLPTITLAVYPLALIIRMTRASMLDEISAAHVRTAHGKGLPPLRIALVHTLPNALVPVITIVGLQVATIISGSAIVETVFAWNGMGALAVEAVGARDYPLVQTIVLLSGAAFAFVNMLVDLLYILIDPRMRVSS